MNLAMRERKMNFLKLSSVGLLVLIFAGSVQASPLTDCPDLSGTFLCKENSYRIDTLYSFSRFVQNGFWRYEMKTRSLETGKDLAVFQFLADAQEQIVLDQITGQSLNLSASCSNQVLEVRGNFQTPAGVKIHFSEDLSLDRSKDLSNVSLDIQGKVVQEICQRQ